MDEFAGRTADCGLAPFRTAAECIDFTLPCASIFLTKGQAKAWAKLTGRGCPKRPLAENTLRRIARGLVKFVLEHPQPFIVATIAPYLMTNTTGHAPGSVEDPAPTLATGNHQYVVVPLLVGAGGPAYSDKPVSAGEPMGTLMTENHRGLVVPLLSKYHGAKSEGDTRANPTDQPINSLDTSNRFGLVAAFVNKHHQGVTGQTIDQPLHTITAGSGAKRPAGAAHAMGLSMVKLRGTCQRGQPIDEPLCTLSAGGNHAGLVATFLQTYYGNSKDGHDARQPSPTVVSKDRIGLVTVNVEGAGVGGREEEFVVVDIGMRMLEPDELLRAQFGEFADGYVLNGTKAQKVALIGNSVPPHLARAIVAANYRP